jgi:hypothetical protein
MAFVAELMAVVDGLTKISFTFPSNYGLAIKSIALWYWRHFGIASSEGSTPVPPTHAKAIIWEVEED